MILYTSVQESVWDLTQDTGSMLSSLLNSPQATLACFWMGDRQLGAYVYMSTVILLNTHLQGLPLHHKCVGYVQIYINVCVCVCVCVQDSETDNFGTIWGGNICKVNTKMNVKNQKQVLTHCIHQPKLSFKTFMILESFTIMISKCHHQTPEPWFQTKVKELEEGSL